MHMITELLQDTLLIDANYCYITTNNCVNDANKQ